MNVITAEVVINCDAEGNVLSFSIQGTSSDLTDVTFYSLEERPKPTVTKSVLGRVHQALTQEFK